MVVSSTRSLLVSVLIDFLQQIINSSTICYMKLCIICMLFYHIKPVSLQIVPYFNDEWSGQKSFKDVAISNLKYSSANTVKHLRNITP